MINKCIYSFVVACLVCSSVFGQIDALFDYKVYYTPNNWKPYIETHLKVDAKSMVLAPITNHEYQGLLGLVVAIEKDQNIISISKNDITTPIFQVSDNKGFYDLQRLSCDTGNVQLFLTLTDLKGDLTKVDSIELPIQITSIKDDSIYLADLELVHSLTKIAGNSKLSKAGYEIIPKLLKYYPEEENLIQFYTECYFPNLDSSQTTHVVLRYYLKPAGKSRQKFGMNPPKRIETGNVLPIIGQIDVQTLPSGEYELVLEVVNRDKKIIAKKTSQIFRNNPKGMLTISGNPEDLIKDSFIGSIENYDTLKNYIDCLRPIADRNEKDIIDTKFSTKTSNTTQMQLFFYRFWYARNSLNPSESWIRYREDVNRVNRNYGNNFRKGYETDRGIIYLKYGPPNSVSSKVEPSAYPYEIWYYQQIANTANKKFVFYSPTLVGNDFVLLHSNMIGELSNPNWVRELYNRTSNDTWGNPTQGGAHWGTQAEDLYNNPR